MKVAAIQTEVFHSGDDLRAFLKKNLRSRVKPHDIVVVTSKIVSLAEGRLVSKEAIAKRELIASEAELILGEGTHGAVITWTEGLMVPSAGIDESNSERADYILYPKDPYASAQKIFNSLAEDLGLSDFGVILSDSRSSPFRRGVTGVALAHWGFRATHSLIGQPDMFGRPLRHTHVNVADSLAAAAVFVMGEAADRCPLAIISGAQLELTAKSSRDEVAMTPSEDMYFPIFKASRN